jgi:amino acid adenylation domain-containing protein
MAPNDIEAIYPLSPMQEGMLFHSLYAPASGVYFQQLDCTLQGPLNIPVFKQIWQRTMEGHAVLRTLFMWERRDKPLQVVRQEVKLPWVELDWRELSPDEQQRQLEAFLQADRAQGFDLAKAPLMRLALIHLAKERYQFIWSFHHLLLDGWSASRLINQVFSQYEAFQRDEDLPLAPSRPYRDYIAWLQRQDLSQAERYWRQTLRGFATPTRLPFDRSPDAWSGSEQTYAEQQAQLSPVTTDALQAMARQQQVTLNTLVQGAWTILLSRYSGQTDVVFGATVAGRPPDLAGVEAMIGLFINTLPVRIQVSPEATLATWLKTLQTQQAEARQYEYSPLAQIQGWSEVARGQALFESILVFENYPVSNPITAQGESVTIQNVRFFEKTNYPLTVTIEPGEAPGLQFSYNSDSFDQATIGRMLGHFQTVLEGMVTQSAARLSELPLLTAAERQQILVDWNQTQANYPRDKCIHHLFEAQVAQTPEVTALVFEDKSLTYRELNRRANQLAHYLQSLGVEPETPVGICLERSLELMVAVLGVLKAGGAYVPLDPTHPPERLAFMVADTQAPLLLTQTRLAASLPAHLTKIICLDAEEAALARQQETNPGSPVAAANRVYVIYTSGSTGQSKGVILNHTSLVNAYLAWENAYQLRSARTVHLQMANFSFDVFSGDWVRALCSGGKLALCPTEFLLDAPQLYNLMRREQVDCAEFVPAVMRNLLQYLEETNQSLDFMRILVVASDNWYVEEYQKIQRFCGPNTRLINSYGLTEATIDSSYFDAGVSGLAPDRLVPIGRPFANTQLYILDRHLQPVPIGVPGELYIGGVGLARGYLNRPEATAERFIPNPFIKNEGGRRKDENFFSSREAFIPHPSSFILYKTGDQARYLPDGNIEFLGRLDYQVKIRGFRVELGEIEVALSQHPAVREAVVLAHEDSPGNKRLVAYIVPRQEGEQESRGAEEQGNNPQSPHLPAELRRYLQTKLPGYMIPAAFVLLETLPLNPSGKIDRRALARLDLTQAGFAETYVAPRNPLEEMLAGIWADVLGLKQVGIYDNFFELGGHSLLAVQLIARIRKTCQVEAQLCWLADAPTVAGLAETLAENMP